MNILEKAKENRENFLGPYRERVIELQAKITDLKTTKLGFERAMKMRRVDNELTEIMAFLLKVEPSHIEEEWIFKIIQGWMRDNDQNKLKSAFRDQKGREKPMSEQDAKWGLFRFTVAQDVRDNSNVVSAIAEFWKSHPEHDEPYLRKKYYEKGKNQPGLKFPYYGRHIRKDENGTYTVTSKGVVITKA